MLTFFSSAWVDARMACSQRQAARGGGRVAAGRPSRGLVWGKRGRCRTVRDPAPHLAPGGLLDNQQQPCTEQIAKLCAPAPTRPPSTHLQIRRRQQRHDAPLQLAAHLADQLHDEMLQLMLGGGVQQVGELGLRGGAGALGRRSAGGSCGGGAAEGSRRTRAAHGSTLLRALDHFHLRV